MKTYDASLYMRMGKQSAKNLTSAQNYQRRIRRPDVNAIKNSFDPYKLDPLKVVERNGKYYVFDGQHRLCALIELFGQDVIVPIVVYKNLPYEKEAELFMTQDEDRRKLTVEERLKARYESGKKDVIEFRDVMEQFGFECDFKKSGGVSGTSNKIGAYGYLWKHIYLKKGVERLRKVLDIATKAYGSYTEATLSELLKGLNCFLDYYDGDYDKQRLISVLKRTSPSVIKNAGKTDGTRTGDAKYAAYIVKEYNSRLTHGRLSVVF